MKLFSTSEAADYLGVKLITMKKYVHGDEHRQPVLKGTKVGNSLVFTQEELDIFKAQRRGRGRPRKGED